MISLERLAQFGFVGALGAVVDMIVLAALHGRLGLPLVVAKCGSAEAGIVVMFAINESWTFADHGHRGVRAAGKRFLTSNVVRAGGFVVGTVVLLALVNWTDTGPVLTHTLGLGNGFLANDFYLVANVVGLGAGFVSNYFCESLVTWRVHRS